MIIGGALCLGETGKSDRRYGKERVWLCPYCNSEFIGCNNIPKGRSKRGGNAHCGCQTLIRQSEKNTGRVPPNKLDDLTASAGKVFAASTKKGRTITIEDVKSLISSDCHYCGDKPSHYRELSSTKWVRISTVPTNGIDRKDSNLGYHLDNCVPCCARCNYLKRDMNYLDFINLCKTIGSRFV